MANNDHIIKLNADGDDDDDCRHQDHLSAVALMSPGVQLVVNLGGDLGYDGLL